MERLAQKYRGQVDFWLVYIREAHPEAADKQGASAPWRADSYAERASLARRLREEAHVARRILVDEMDGASVHRRWFGRFDDPVVVVDREGNIALSKPWMMVDPLRRFLEQLTANGGLWQPGLVEADPSSDSASP